VPEFSSVTKDYALAGNRLRPHDTVELSYRAGSDFPALPICLLPLWCVPVLKFKEDCG